MTTLTIKQNIPLQKTSFESIDDLLSYVIEHNFLVQQPVSLIEVDSSELPSAVKQAYEQEKATGRKNFIPG